MTQREIDEIELSIAFGQRLMDYYLATVRKLASTMTDNDKIRQFFERDKSFINDIIADLEQGFNISSLYAVKKRLSIVGQDFFKDEFRQLKKLAKPE
jgi:hypothetical protein